MAWLLLAVSVSATVLSNAMFKIAMNAFPSQVSWTSLFVFIFNPFLWLGGLSCVVLLASYLFALRDLGLTNTYAINTSLSLVGVTIVSILAFREPVTMPALVGIAFVIAGIFLIGSQATTSASTSTTVTASVGEGVS
jgi:multidrug transporter EmrE-like cation transporter